MIVCSCNVLSEKAVRECLNPGPDCPRTPSQIYGCLGCSPQCGSCARTIRAIIAAAHSDPDVASVGGCGGCCCPTGAVLAQDVA